MAPGIRPRNDAVASGAVDMVGLARALILDPSLPTRWHEGAGGDPVFPRFTDPPEGGITAWYTMALTALAEGREAPSPDDLPRVIDLYETRDRARTALWLRHFR
jgi:hypothetical protein